MIVVKREGGRKEEADKELRDRREGTEGGRDDGADGRKEGEREEERGR